MAVALKLSGFFVHKFKLNNQETLLAYELSPGENLNVQQPLPSAWSSRAY